MAGIDPSLYVHSPVHRAVLARDYDALSSLLAALPRLADSSTVRTEEESLAEEEKADAISAVIDRRDVPNRETPLHLAVCLGDAVSVAMLMAAGADCNLQNEQGWGAIQEAICAREEMLANIIVRCYQPLAWAKWCRRLPRVVASMRRMQDFYMEITFHFESSVIPFISTIAPSDTYKIWKRGSNLRADMTLAGFDGFRIQRSDQSFLFLGDGSEDGKVPPGTLCIIFHKDKQVMNASEDAGLPASEEEAQKEVAMMSRTSIFRPGIDVTQAVLLPQLTWRRQERSEMVGPWKAKVYDMHHVVLSVKSRRVPGAMTVDEFLSSCSKENDTESEEFEDMLTEEERKQLENALKMECPDIIDHAQSDAHVANRHSCSEPTAIAIEDVSSSSSSNIDRRQQDKKSWFGSWGKRGSNHKQDGQKKVAPPRSSVCVAMVGDLVSDSPSRNQTRPGRHSVDMKRAEELKSVRDKENRRSTISSEIGCKRREGSKESEYRKGLRPVLWLSPDFPLRTEELLPLLDILVNKVKAIRRLRDLVTTKLPPGTFPVKVAIPVVPTIRVLVTFTKFEQLQPLEEFSTPPSSPGSKTAEMQTSNSWIQWMKAPYRQSYSMSSGPSSRVEDIQDPFAIPPDYTWTTSEERRKKTKERKKKPKKGKGQNQETIMPD